jgi:hypothetical protein
MPDLLGDEGDQRVQRAQQFLEHEQQGVAGAGGGPGVVAVECRLGEFQEPVAVLVPGELVEGLRNEVEAVIAEVLVDGVQGVLQAVEDPAFGVGAGGGGAGERHRA